MKGDPFMNPKIKMLIYIIILGVALLVFRYFTGQ